MGAPHNPARYGETWPQHRIDAALAELEYIRQWVILSGGWAWHFMSPQGTCRAQARARPQGYRRVCRAHRRRNGRDDAQDRGFQKVWTRYDRLPSDEDFRRYEKSVERPNEKPIRVTVDFFVRDGVPAREIEGWRVIEPKYLLSLYSNIHSSDKCFAVQAATRLVAQGIDPQGRAGLAEIPRTA
jgi:hypothetical protein